MELLKLNYQHWLNKINIHILEVYQVRIRPEEVSNIIKTEIENYKKSLDIKTSGNKIGEIINLYRQEEFQPAEKSNSREQIR